jgi:hypothetical protein
VVQTLDIKSDKIGKPNYEIITMDDRKILYTNYNTKIVMLKIYKMDEKISGLQAFYLYEDKKG